MSRRPAQHFSLAVGLTLLASSPLQAQGVDPAMFRQPWTRQPHARASSIFVVPPPPSDIGAPGQRSSAGSRGEKPLTALVPTYPSQSSLGEELVFGLTSSAQPVLRFYVPYRAPATGELILQEANGAERYRTQVALPSTPGVIRLVLPPSATLEVGHPFRWIFQIYRPSEAQPFKAVDGWIQRRVLGPNLERQLAAATPKERLQLYGAYGLWYDTLNAVAERYSADSKRKDWATLLQVVDLDGFAAEPLLECCQLQP